MRSGSAAQPQTARLHFHKSHRSRWIPLYAPPSRKPSDCWRRLHFIRAHKNYQSGWNSAAVAIGNIKRRCGFSARKRAHQIGANHQPPGAWICPSSVVSKRARPWNKNYHGLSKGIWSCICPNREHETRLTSTLKEMNIRYVVNTLLLQKQI